VSGFIYMLGNPAMPGLFKVGRTALDPRERAKQLSRVSGVPAEFEALMYSQVRDALSAEWRAHYQLQHFRMRRQREFFRLDSGYALYVAQAVLRTLGEVTVTPAGAELFAANPWAAG
jgi:hypothetical protein